MGLIGMVTPTFFDVCVAVVTSPTVHSSYPLWLLLRRLLGLFYCLSYFSEERGTGSAGWGSSGSRAIALGIA